jgi:hypothetical protein
MIEVKLLSVSSSILLWWKLLLLQSPLVNSVAGRWSRLGLVSLLFACSDATRPENRCPGPKGEFPPVACALVSGVAEDQVGVALTEMGLRVDSSILGRGYHYASNAFATDQDGRFSMLVYRINELTPASDPDTASVAVKLHVSRAPAPRDTPLSTALVRMTFAPLGELVTPTVVDLRFPITR